MLICSIKFECYGNLVEYTWIGTHAWLINQMLSEHQFTFCRCCKPQLLMNIHTIQQWQNVNWCSINLQANSTLHRARSGNWNSWWVYWTQLQVFKIYILFSTAILHHLALNWSSNICSPLKICRQGILRIYILCR